MTKDTIEIGDLVDIEYGRAECVYRKATVLHVPGATGDAWHLRLSDGTLMYLQNYDTICQVKP